MYLTDICLLQNGFQHCSETIGLPVISLSQKRLFGIVHKTFLELHAEQGSTVYDIPMGASGRKLPQPGNIELCWRDGFGHSVYISGGCWQAGGDGRVMSTFIKSLLTKHTHTLFGYTFLLLFLMTKYAW
eukprot:Phypoly_transcript_23864.p1 GENE.Phypoly_transcript_23864~~Phypoly_transcript_23864.p1  ORF type:complete len:129 (+),score=1.96 Phypoly_transcript_23864:115-501(+)